MNKNENEIDSLILEKLEKYSQDIYDLGVDAIKLSKSGKSESEISEILEINIKNKISNRDSKQ